MFRHSAGILALVVLVTLTAGGFSSAGIAAKKQHVVIDQLERPGTGTFTLLPDPGPIARDEGTYTWVVTKRTKGSRDGQAFKRYISTVTFVGQSGTLVVREDDTIVGAAVNKQVATGTWKVLRGTGAYAGVTGGGRQAAVLGILTPAPWRYEGFLTSP